MPSKPITREDDLDSGHQAYRPGMPANLGSPDARSPIQHLPIPNNIYSGSGNVKAGKRGVHRQGDVRALHVNISTGVPEIVENPKCYGGGILPWLRSGSFTVFTNSKQTGRVGDPVICGSVIFTGDETVLIGD